MDLGEKRQILPCTTLKDLVFITKVKSVYCTIHTESLYDTETFRFCKVKLTTVCGFDV